MAAKNARSLKMNNDFEDRMEAIVPEVLLAIVSLEFATPEKIHSHLEQNNVKATRSETEMALEFGCKIGAMEERRRYRLISELRDAIKNSDQSNRISDGGDKPKLHSSYKNEDYKPNGSMDDDYNDDKGSGSDLSVNRSKSDEKEIYSNDYDADSRDDDFNVGDDMEEI